MTIIGRITRNAVVHQLKDGRNVVHFSVAINDYYKPKGATEGIYATTYVNCSYWKGRKISERLKRGCLVELTGRLYVTTYISKEGEAKASLNCHVNKVNIHTICKEVEVNGSIVSAKPGIEEAKDEAPF